MKTLIVSINSKYVHASLAAWYLFSGVRQYGKTSVAASVREFTINQSVELIADALTKEQADVYAFCTYIWNVETLRAVLPLIKKAVPQCTIILGGPEATFHPNDLLNELPIDFVSLGEGEESLPRLLDALAIGGDIANVDGVAYKTANGVCIQPAKPLQHLPPDPFLPEYFETLNGRIAYIEGSRGCPFSCAFCLSGRDDCLRLFPIERVKRDILRMAVSGAKTIKFVDRTFNCHKQRCDEILRFLLSEYGKGIPKDVCFHFEVAADLFDAETLSLLASMPKGFIQMEAGLQSFHADTLQAVTRKTDLHRLCDNVRCILQNGNMHLHVDLIAGLPKEDLEIFKYSFNMAYALQPHMLQLGFLKLLYGSALRAQAAENGYVFSEKAPYEVTASNWMQPADFKLLHGVEDALERLYNSGRFTWTLQYVLKQTSMQPFDLFAGFAAFLEKKGVQTVGMKLDAYTALVMQYFSSLPHVVLATLQDALACDSLCSKRLNCLPSCLFQKDARTSKIVRQLAKNDTVKGIKRNVYILQSQRDKAVVVTYTQPDKVTSRYPLQMVSLHAYT